MSRLRQRFVSVAAATALLGGATVPAVVMAPVAAAHSVMLSIDPQDGGEVENSPEQVVLTFNEEINQNFVTVAVTTEGDTTNRVAGEPTVNGETVTAQVEDLAPGNYTVGYRVTSADGHVVSGSSTFRVIGAEGAAGAEAAGGQASEAQASDAPPSQDGETEAADAESSDAEGRVNPAIWVVAGLAAVLIAGAFFLLRRGGD